MTRKVTIGLAVICFAVIGNIPSLVHAQADNSIAQSTTIQTSNSYESKVAAVREQFAAQRTSLGLGNAPGQSSSPESDLGEPICMNTEGGGGGGSDTASTLGKKAQQTSCIASSKGAPVWLVNMVNLNFYMADTPLWYSSPIGPPVEIKLSYNSQSSIYGSNPLGSKWQLNYGSYLYTMNDNNSLPAATAVVMPNGKWDIFGLPDANGNCAPPYHVFNTLTKVAANRFELKFPDGMLYVYDIPSGLTSSVSLLVEIRDSHGQKLSLGYDSNARLSTVTDALGKVTTLSYNASGLISQVTDPFGRFAALQYDGSGNLTKITDMGGYWTSFTYDGNAYLSGLTNAGGSWGFYFEPADGTDNGGNPYPAPGAAMGSSDRITVTDPSGGREEFYRYRSGAWHISPKNYVPYLTASNNNYTNNVPRTNYSYFMTTSLRGEIGQIISPEGTETDFSYNYYSVPDNSAGNLLGMTIPDGGVSFTYNAAGSITAISEAWLAYQNTTTMTYAPNGIDPINITDGLGTVVIGYNDSRDIASITDRLGKTVTFTYNSYGQITSTTDQLGTITNYVYDANNFLAQITRNSQTLMSFTRDATGRIRTYTDSRGLTLTYSYNNLDDIVRITFPDGKDISQTYSGSVPHLVTSITGRSGSTAQFNFNALKQLTEVLNAEGGTTELVHDANGNTIQLTDPIGNVTKLDYNNDNLLIKKTLADGTSEAFTYATGRVASHTNARGATASYSYDGPDTIGEKTYTDGSTSSIFNTHDQYHRLTETVDASGTYLYSYDNNSRPISIDGALAGDTLVFQYDAAGRKTGYTLEEGQSVSYTYDAFDRLTLLQNMAGTFSFSYNGANPLVQRLTRPNGSYTEYQYDTLMRLTGLTNRTSTGTIINQYLYTYNDQDLRSAETITNGTPITTFQNEAQDYTFNSVNELVSSTNPVMTNYTFDADGNMINGYVPAGVVFTAKYDAESSLIHIENDGPDQCTLPPPYPPYTIPCPHSRDFSYRSDGFMAKSTKTDGLVTPVVTNYVSDGPLPLQERDNNNNVIREYTWGPDLGGGIGGLLSLRQNGQDYYYLYDGKGNVAAVISNSQSVVATYSYDPFGQLMTETGTVDQPYKFSTKPYDEQTGLSYYGYRFYSPSVGRWMTRDPIREFGGLNLYGFSGNDPSNRIDPLGLYDTVENSNQMLKDAVDKLHREQAENDPNQHTWADDVKNAVSDFFKTPWDFWKNRVKHKIKVFCSSDPRDGMEAIGMIPVKVPVNMGSPADYGKYGEKAVDAYVERNNTFAGPQIEH